jgi:hypothetical protein
MCASIATITPITLRRQMPPAILFELAGKNISIPRYLVVYFRWWPRNDLLLSNDAIDASDGAIYRRHKSEAHFHVMIIESHSSRHAYPSEH